jgi:hypothetical protein
MPHFNLKKPIPPKYIKEILRLDPGHPVFLIRGLMEEKLVIKVEQLRQMEQNVVPSPEHVKVNASVMSAISRDTKPQVMTAEEIDNLSHGIIAFKPRLGGEIVDDLLAWINMPKSAVVKLPFVENLTHLEAAGKKVAKNSPNYDKTGVVTCAEALNKPGGIEKLGQLVAVDLFTGNTDRFYPDMTLNGRGGALWPPGLDKAECVRLKVLVNVGNVFFGGDGNGSVSVQALDTFDPNSPTGDMTRQMNLNQWPGQWLLPDQSKKLEKFAGFIIDDLNTVLGPRRRSKIKKLFGAQVTRLDPGCNRRLLVGIAEGTAKMRAKFVGKDNLAPGVSQRAEMLGWI